MLPLLPFHTLAAQRGDGLRPELLALFARNARSDTGLSARIEIENIARSDNRCTPETGEGPDREPPEKSLATDS
ncbi:hypothetical protein LMG28138_05521 [Pararobbsia alpina]|uniref:Uncharacterized protein n=1 Tax=Pararobbsia alpina TaxID=621374 RepID=A0A6S7CAH4_9BURK|nr:hypothetical protein LMG28138_05521 [Pararobbsia alpina]